MGLFTSRPEGVIRMGPNMVISSWEAVVPEAKGKAEKLWEEIERRMKEKEIPNLLYGREQVDGFFGDTKTSGQGSRPCFYFTNQEKMIGGPYITVVGAHDYGTYLLVSRWLLAPNLKEHLTICNIFEKEIISAYLSIAHSVVVGSVEQITTDLQQDFSKINTQAKGMLNIV
ncbi:MAG: hypothetical protein Q7S01_05175 [bacterium]|nr:hypothetical protein [bacterium]